MLSEINSKFIEGFERDKPRMFCLVIALFSLPFASFDEKFVPIAIEKNVSSVLEVPSGGGKSLLTGTG